MFMGCFNGNEFCNSSLYKEWSTPFNDTNHSTFQLPPISQGAPVRAAIVAVTSVIVCCITYICHKCCRKSYENNCFPMIHKIKYDTSNP